ncbi:hypothetical protein [uncultured Arthrobacter sp.]|uniref:hypothetical protein n=1 Tax=uncultured Arthrobacter sp. TaxID=114050 RepID=UPI0025DF8A7B|nr:hypothetical protein [uncultured Arthrobacter sp.]
MSRECRCGRPTRDEAYCCDNCGDALSRALGDVTWLDAELETSITRQQGIDYRRVGGGKGGKATVPSPANMGASDARTHLKALLVTWALFCNEEGIRNSSPHAGLPADTLPALSAWLLWRVDGLTLHDIGPEAVDEITSAVAHCHRHIDRPADRQFLGDCREQECDGRVYARPGGDVARCEACGTTTPAEQIRARLLEELDDRLCTAAEIARLSTYLGLKAGRESVRKHVEYLSRAGRIEKHSAISDTAVYRFGEVYGLLVMKDYGKQKTA